MKPEDFPYTIENVPVKDFDKEENRDYKLYRGKKGSLNLGNKKIVEIVK